MNKHDGKFFSREKRDHVDIIFTFGPYDTREKCIEASEYEFDDDFEVGKLKSYEPHIPYLLDELTEQGCDNGGMDGDWPDITKKQEEDLENVLTDCLRKWLVENKAYPSFGLIEDVTEHANPLPRGKSK